MNRLYQPPLLIWAVAFGLGVAVGLSSAPEWVIASIAFAAAVFGAVCASRLEPGSSLRRINIVLLLLAPALFGIGVWRAQSTEWNELSLARADFGAQPVTVHGAVAGDPVFRGTRIDARLRTESITLAGERRQIAEQIQLSLPGDLPIEPGDRLRVTARLTSTAINRNDDGYHNWLAAQGVAAVGVVEPGDVAVVGRKQPSWWRTAFHESRTAVNRSLQDALSPPLAGLAQGMVTGDRGAIDRPLRDDLNTTSLSHLIVVSGANLTLLTAIVMTATSWLLGRRPSAALAIVAALAYAGFAGGDPPVIRALGMALVFTSAHMLGRGSAALDAIAVAAGVMIALEPQILRDVSFQLTLAGTLGLVLLMPSLMQRQLAGIEGFGSAMRAVALVSLIAMLATMPLIALHFQRVSLIGLAANIIVAPLFAWMFLGAFAVGIIGLLSGAIAGIVSWPAAWLPLSWLRLVAEQGAQIPGAAQSVKDFGAIHAVVIYIAMLSAAVRPRREVVARWHRTRRDATDRAATSPIRRLLAPLAATAALIAVAITLWLTALDRDEELAIHFIDVGQGDAALIVTPDRQTILIDTGRQADALLAALRTHLPPGSKRIDLVVVTHPQSDHAEATWALLERYDIGRLAASPHLEQTALGRSLTRTARDRSIPLNPIEAGMQIAFAGDPHPLMLDVLWPPSAADAAVDAVSDPNTLGLVLRLRYGDAAFLFAADIGAEQEITLVQQPCSPSPEPCLLRSDVLKVAHHGSRYSTTRVLLDRVRPTLAVISAGADNPHGHPHPETIETLNQSGVAVLTTAERGTVSLRSDGAMITWTTER